MTLVEWLVLLASLLFACLGSLVHWPDRIQRIIRHPLYIT